MQSASPFRFQRSTRRPLVVVMGAVGALSVGASAQTPPATRTRVDGAGATFPALLYKKWIAAYAAQHPDTVIEYKDVGSGEVVLSRDVYADIFLRRITRGDDPRIRAANPQLSLSHLNIEVVARLDGSGTTFALSNHLSAISPAWRESRGTGYMIEIERAMRARQRRRGRCHQAQRGAIGYVEYAFSLRLGLPMAQLQNQAGQFVRPSDRSGQVALASQVKEMPENLPLHPRPPTAPTPTRSRRSVGSCCTASTPTRRRVPR